MSLVKEAENFDLDGQSVSREEHDRMQADDSLYVIDVSLDDDKEEEHETSVMAVQVGDSKPIAAIQVGDDEPVVFSLPKVPGAEDQEDIETIEVEEEEPVEIEHDPYAWKLESFLDWFKSMAKNVPKHSGKDVSGLERAIAYMNWLLGEASKASRQDIKGVLDVQELEDCRLQVHDGISRLEKRLDQVRSTKFKPTKGKKKADVEPGLVKEAKAATFNVNVPLFISHVARVCINSMVSAGHDIERTFGHMVKKYGLTNREQAEVIQLLSDMNYPMPRLDRALIGEDIDYTSSDNHDLNANYPG